MKVLKVKDKGLYSYRVQEYRQFEKNWTASGLCPWIYDYVLVCLSRTVVHGLESSSK